MAKNNRLKILTPLKFFYTSNYSLVLGLASSYAVTRLMLESSFVSHRNYAYYY